jgi:LacI family transcriptional regulator
MPDRTASRAAGPRRPTLADVARRAGVAPVTVSRALNAPDLVNKETLTRITEAIDLLGYQVNPAARALAGSTWNTVGVLVPSLDHIMFQHHLAVFEAEMAARSISLLISAMNYDVEAEVKALRGLVTRGVDAILLTHVEAPDTSLSILDGANMPRVLMGSHGREHFPVWCGYDDREAMHKIADHLLELGHRRIGVVGDTRAAVNGRLRVAAVTERLAEGGAILDDDLLTWCGPDDAEARAAFTRLMSLPRPPSAIVCGNDDLALSVMSAARDAGIDIPGQVAVTGFDGTEITGHPLISLTTVRAAWRRLGKSTAELVIAQIEGRSSVPVLVPTELVARRSTVGGP